MMTVKYCIPTRFEEVRIMASRLADPEHSELLIQRSALDEDDVFLRIEQSDGCGSIFVSIQDLKEAVGMIDNLARRDTCRE